jgi:hypothetical protein
VLLRLPFVVATQRSCRDRGGSGIRCRGTPLAVRESTAWNSWEGDPPVRPRKPNNATARPSPAKTLPREVAQRIWAGADCYSMRCQCYLRGPAAGGRRIDRAGKTLPTAFRRGQLKFRYRIRAPGRRSSGKDRPKEVQSDGGLVRLPWPLYNGLYAAGGGRRSTSLTNPKYRSDQWATLHAVVDAV